MKILLIALVAAASWTAVWYFFGGFGDRWVCVNGEWAKRGNPTTEKPTSGCGDEKKSETTPKKGTIEGSLGFPSGGIPSGMKICAQNTSTKKKYCTTKQIENKKYTYGVGYKIKVPAGKYYVYAYIPGGGGGYEESYHAYYDKFVTCGMSVACTSHKRIVVTVKAGKTVSKIDPQDWYNL